jgi:signal transduction histidine kinase
MHDITKRVRAEERLLAANERLQALSRRLVEVQEAERRHIARELHDEVGQVLTGLNLLLGMSPRATADTVETRLGEARALVEELIEKVDELSLDLRPAMLDDLGLLPALLWHFERYATQTGVRVSLEHSGMERRFATELETALYRVVQEALTNVARHAGVNEVTVRVWADQVALSVQVEDQGVGFDPRGDLVARGNGGLSGMYERATSLGGQLLVETALGTGTCLTAEWPLDGQHPEESS